MKQTRTKLAMALAVLAVGTTVTNGVYLYPTWKNASSRYESLTSSRQQVRRGGGVFERESQWLEASARRSEARNSVQSAGLWSAGFGFLGLLLGLFGLLQKEGGAALAAMLLSVVGGGVGMLLAFAV